jgi:hypothetical protein
VIQEGELVALSFVLVQGGRRYVHHGPRRIDLSTLERGLYKVWAVQDFEAEWQNPDLSSSLARICVIPIRVDGSSDSPVDFPIESRPLDYFGVLVLR